MHIVNEAEKVSFVVRAPLNLVLLEIGRSPRFHSRMSMMEDLKTWNKTTLAIYILYHYICL